MKKVLAVVFLLGLVMLVFGSVLRSIPLPVQSTVVNLQWDPVTDSNLAGYNVYRATSPQQYSGIPLNGGLIHTVAFSDNTVVRGTTYYYVCTAVSTAGLESMWSNEIQVIIPNTRPSVPQNLRQVSQ